jgi:FkbM family methyltransferase
MNAVRETGSMISRIQMAELEALRERFRNGSAEKRAEINATLGPVEIEFADIRMIVDPRDNYTETCIWLDGHPPELRSLLALVELVEDKNAFVLDIGANCGAFAVPLGLACGMGSRVVAFEPNPVMIGRLGQNIRLNDLSQRIRIEGCALSDRDGEALLYFRGHNYGQASLKRVRKKQRTGGVLVPTRPLSAFTGAARNHDLSVLKIDVEGAEEVVLGPLLEDAKTGGWLPDAILIEVRHADQWETDLCAKIASCGYETTFEDEGNALYTKV